MTRLEKNKILLKKPVENNNPNLIVQELMKSTALKSNSSKQFDVAIIGGGIIGCATARQLSIQHPTLKIAIFEKEQELAKHQSGNNSGVIHAGIYYAVGSLKAKLCVRGMELSYKYFDEQKIPYKKCGKLIVAVEPHELPALDVLFQRSQANGVKDVKMIDGKDIVKYEPYCKGLKALWSPHTGAVDWGFVTLTYGKDFLSRHGAIFMNHKIVNFVLSKENSEAGRANEYPLTLKFNNQPDVQCKFAITCAGLYSDHVSRLSGCSPLPKIVPFRGEYLVLKPEKRYLVKGNIYPVPDPRFPFLGVHFTPRINGDVWLGPNAVLALRREGYTWTDVNFRELFESLTFSGMQRLMIKYAVFGTKEMYRSFSLFAQVKQLQRFVPELSVKDVTRGPAGVRAQALDSAGNLVDDFVFDSGSGDLAPRVLHVRNAPSPAATSSLAIAEMVADKAKEKFLL